MGWTAGLALGYGLGSLSVAVLLMGKVPSCRSSEKPTINEKLQEMHMPQMQERNPTNPVTNPTSPVTSPTNPVYPASLFNMDQPQGRTVDINIGTHFLPMPKTPGNFLILVDPLPNVCAHVSRQVATDVDVAMLCCAVSNFSGSTTFKVLNDAGGSSSLVETTVGTSHERFKPTQIFTVIVLEAYALLGGLVAKQNRIEKLKTDMQGFDLTALQNLRPILLDKEQVLQIKSECFFKNSAGKQIYHIDNECQKMLDYLTDLGYTAKIKPAGPDGGDVWAYKPPATDFGDPKFFEAK